MLGKFRLKSYNDFIGIVFPKKCPVCEAQLSSEKQSLCVSCLVALPYYKANLHQRKELEILMKELNIKHFDAMLVYHKGNKGQEIIHQLKYQGRKDLSAFLGSQYIERKPSILNEQWDVVAAVPLHKNKTKKRGYNQLSGFLETLGKKTALPTSIELLIRIKNTDSQTKLNREKRLKHLSNTFVVSNNFAQKNIKRILMVDDVVTTGATTIACTQALKNTFPNATIGWIFMAVVE